MSTGDGREGAIRIQSAQGQEADRPTSAQRRRGRLSGKLAGLSLPRQIMVIAFWPFLEQVINFCVSTTDVMLATHMYADNPQLTQHVADGISMGGYIMWLGFIMQGAVAMGASALVSRNTGARRFAQANHAMIQAAILGLTSGVLSCVLMLVGSHLVVDILPNFTPQAAGYMLQFVDIVALNALFSGVIFALNASLRGSGDTRLPFNVMATVGVLNIVLGITYVFGFGWGISGIALGTLSAYMVGFALLVTTLLWRRKRLFAQHPHAMSVSEIVHIEETRDPHYAPPLFLNVRGERYDWKMQSRILNVGVPQAVEFGIVWVCQIFCLSIISQIPVEGVIGVHNIAMRIESISFLPGFAIGMAGSTLVGQYLGARNAMLARIIIWKCLRYAVTLMGTFGILFCLFPITLMELFVPNVPGMVDAGVPVLRVLIFAQPFFAACIVLKMALRTAGDTRRVMCISLGILAFFRVGVTYAWHTLAPDTITLWGIWCLFTLEMAIQTFIFFRIVKGKSWTNLKV